MILNRFVFLIYKLNIVIIFLFIGNINSAQAMNNYEYNDSNKKCISEDAGFRNNPQGRGWFWKEEDCIDNEIYENKSIDHNNLEKDSNKIYDKFGQGYEKSKTTQNIPWDILDKISPKDIREKIEVEARDIAVNYPTYENIYEYNKLKKYIMDKAYNYAIINTQIVNSNKDFNSDNLNSSFAIKNYETNENLKIDNLLKNNKDNFLLLFFKSETCPYCKKQAPIITDLSNAYNLNLIPLEIEDYKEFAYAFKATTIPDIFIIYSHDKTYINTLKNYIYEKNINNFLSFIEQINNMKSDQLRIQRLSTGLISNTELKSRISLFFNYINIK